MTKKPTNPPIIYTNGVDLFLEWPTYVLRFAFTEAGLHRALAHIPNIAPPPRLAPVANKVLPKLAASTRRKREINNFSPELRQAATELLRRRFG